MTFKLERILRKHARFDENLGYWVANGDSYTVTDPDTGETNEFPYGFSYCDDVPFEDDILRRYGEPGVRESSTDFWKNLMLRYRGEAAPIVMVPPGSLESKVGFIAQNMKDRFADKTCNVREFLREVDPNK